MNQSVLSAMLVATSLFCAAPLWGAEAILDCEAVGNARPICGFKNPEDMVVLPGNKALVIGEYGATAEEHVGELTLFILSTEERRTLFRAGETKKLADSVWGDPNCQTPPSAFNAHGIDLVRRDDGRLALLVIQHASREAIELFELVGEGENWNATWRGCIPAPEDASLNSVAGLPDGRLYTTKMDSIAGAGSVEGGLPQEPTGVAYVWSAEHGFREIPGTVGSLPNGIVRSPDGHIIYMNVGGENAIRKIEVATGKELGRAPVPIPDNVKWAPDGRRLLVASLQPRTMDDFKVCERLSKGACPVAFQIIAVDSETMTTLGPIYSGDGPPMGGGTVGLQVGDELFIGAFEGDRILRVQLPSDTIESQ